MKKIKVLLMAILSLAILSSTACNESKPINKKPSTADGPQGKENNKGKSDSGNSNSAEKEESIVKSIFHDDNPLPIGKTLEEYEAIVLFVEKLKIEKDNIIRGKMYLSKFDEITSSEDKVKFQFFIIQTALTNLVDVDGVLRIDNSTWTRPWFGGEQPVIVGSVSKKTYAKIITKQRLLNIEIKKLCITPSFNSVKTCSRIKANLDSISLLVTYYQNRFNQGDKFSEENKTSIESLAEVSSFILNEQHKSAMALTVLNDDILPVDTITSSMFILDYDYYNKLSLSLILETEAFWKLLPSFLKENKLLINTELSNKNMEESYRDLGQKFKEFSVSSSNYSLVHFFKSEHQSKNKGNVELGRIIFKLENMFIDRGIDNSTYLDEFISNLKRENQGSLNSLSEEELTNFLSEYDIPIYDEQAEIEEYQKRLEMHKKTGSKFRMQFTSKTELRRQTLVNAIFFGRR